jgi:hypothetical protein
MIKLSPRAARLASCALPGLLALVWSGCSGPDADPDEAIEQTRAALTSGSVQINCGGPAVGPYLADDNFSGGSPRTRTNTIDMSGAPNPAPMAVYQSQRFGDFTYTIKGFPPNLLNTVRLHFADTHWTTTNQRIFNVSINGSLVLQNFDLVASAGAGNKAYITSFAARSDAAGQYVIQFTTVKDAATVSGIEVQAATALVGAWTVVGAAPPSGLLTNGTQMQLLTDGSILFMNGSVSTSWYKLTPDAKGKYENGTWSQVASSHFARVFYPSTMLKDGRYMMGGGEYVVGTNRSSMDIYDPVLDLWKEAAEMPNEVGDTAASITRDGRFYVASIFTSDTYLYDSTRDQWTMGVGIGTGGNGDEKGWNLLQTGSILDAFDVGSVFDSTTNGGLGSWSPTGAIPVRLVDTGAEIGAPTLLHNGNVIVWGAYDPTQLPNKIAHSAIYDPSTNLWTAGPDAPDGLQWGDTSAAVLPNGHVLVATSPSNVSLGGGTQIMEYDPLGQGTGTTHGTFTVVASNFSTQTNEPKINFPIFLNLPTGQVLLADLGDPKVHIYTPTGGVGADAWRPSIISATSGLGGIWGLSGRQLNGLTTGSTFGDDRNSSSSYPIVSLKDSAGNVYYARTYDFDQMAPLVTWLGMCHFSLPPSIPNGTYTLSVAANGVPSSNTTTITVTGNHVKSVSGSSVAPNATATWTVKLAVAAPSGGTVIKLSSDNTSVVTVPATVTVASGATSATFTVTGKAYGFAHITADLQTTNNQFQPVIAKYGWQIDSVLESDNLQSILGPTDTSATFNVGISAPAPAGGLVVSLSSSDPGAAKTGVSVIVPAGARTASFGVTRGTSTTGARAMITTSLVGDAKRNSCDTYNGKGITAQLPLL